MVFPAGSEQSTDDSEWSSLLALSNAQMPFKYLPTCRNLRFKHKVMFVHL
jgi:hypothetical protein